MKCPLCGNSKTFTRGTISRLEFIHGKEFSLTRRQRWCPKCLKWHVTIEMVECDEVTWLPAYGYRSLEKEIHG